MLPTRSLHGDWSTGDVRGNDRIDLRVRRHPEQRRHAIEEDIRRPGKIDSLQDNRVARLPTRRIETENLGRRADRNKIAQARGDAIGRMNRDHSRPRVRRRGGDDLTHRSHVELRGNPVEEHVRAAREVAAIDLHLTGTSRRNVRIKTRDHRCSRDDQIAGRDKPPPCMSRPKSAR